MDEQQASDLGWPFPDRPGVPSEPHVSRAHWLDGRAREWDAESQSWHVRVNSGLSVSTKPEQAASFSYDGPVLTKAEIAKLVERRVRDARMADVECLHDMADGMAADTTGSNPALITQFATVLACSDAVMANRVGLLVKLDNVDVVAREIWAVAQRLPGEAVEDGVARLTARLAADHEVRYAAERRTVATTTMALASAIRVADEARDKWDKAPGGMKAGKLLIALSGRLPGYREDIDAIHAAIKGKSA